MNQITKIERQSLAPNLSGKLEQIINHEPVSRHADSAGNVMVIQKPRPHVDEEAIQEARKALQAYENCQNVSDDILNDFLLSFMFSAVNPPSQNLMDGRISVYLNVLRDYPAYVFTVEVLKRAQKSFKFFPALAELCEIFDAELENHKKIISGLKRIVANDIKPGEGADAPRMGGLRPIGYATADAIRPKQQPIREQQEGPKIQPKEKQKPAHNSQTLAKKYRDLAANAVTEADKALYALQAAAYEKQARGELRILTTSN